MKKWFCFFTQVLCKGFVGNLCMLFFHVFARIIWLVLKVNQHVFHVGLGQFDNF